MAKGRGLRQIGSPLAKIADGLMASDGAMSGSNGSQAASEITSPGPTAGGPSSTTGPELGATGAVALMTPARDAVLGALRRADIGTAQGRLLGLLTQLPGSPPLIVREVLADDWSVKGYVWESGRKLDAAERVMIEPVLAALTDMALEEQIARWVAQYIAPMASRERTEIDNAAYIALFIEELIDYPAPVIRHAMRQWSRHNKFRPTLHEIIILCDAEMDWIRKLGEIVR